MKTIFPKLVLYLATLLTLAGAAGADEPLLFVKPEQAVESLKNATTKPDLALFRQLFGADIDKLVSVNPEVRRVAVARLRDLFAEGWSLTDAESGHKIVRLGYEGWAFPVPLVRGSAGWHFDTEAGLEELKNRTVGRNELKAIRAMRILSDAQEAYRMRDYNGDGEKNYADRIVSDPGKMNGLYWPETVDAVSPLQMLLRDPGTFAEAVRGSGVWNGYNFRFTSEGDGYTLIAWPETYDATGVMSFVLTSSGGLFEADLGPDGRPTGKPGETKGEAWKLAEGGY